MQSKALWLLLSLAWLAVFGVFLPLLGRWSGWFTILESLTAGTGLVIFWYTLETHQVRREMAQQNEIAIQPVIVANIEERQAGPRNEMIVRNVGRGTALFVRIRDLSLTDVAGDGVRFVAKFAQIDYLEPTKDCVVVAKCTATNAKAPPEELDFLPSLDPSTAIERYNVTVEYQDINGRPRQTNIQMGKGGIQLLNPGASRWAKT